MELTVSRATISKIKAEGVILPVFEDAKDVARVLQVLDRAGSGFLNRIMQSFGGERLKTMMCYTGQAFATSSLILVGLGKRAKCNLDTMRGAGGKAFLHARDLGLKRVAVPARLMEGKGFEREEVLEAFLAGGLLGIYRFTVLKTQGKESSKTITECLVIASTQAEESLAARAVKSATVISRAVCLARDLVMLPPNRKTPTILARKAKTVALENRIQCRILGEAQARRLGMGAFLAVAQGSREPAKLMVLIYNGGKSRDAPLVLVGKGITFDSGGISLKTPKSMERMKDDMAGGAAVLGAIQAASQFRIPLNLVGIVPATENLPDGKAYKPGDVLTSLSGETIEVVTTDAEGRLILADALTYAGRFKPRAIIDLATLTGSCVVALGDHVAGAMGNNDSLMAMVKAAGEKSGERVWELPLWEEYADYLKSEIADIKNAGGRPAGTITAGVFLSRFVKGTPWVHLDIAGPVWSEKAKPYAPKGATGFGVRLLIQLLRNWKDNVS